MAYDNIIVDTKGPVGIITLNRPKAMNALNSAIVGEIGQALDSFEADDAIGCIVITGSGDRAFSAGGDIHEQRENDVKFDQDELDRRNDEYLKMSYEIGACSKPTIGMMNGLAYGGAGVLASSLDMRIGCEDTKFRFLAAAYGRINSTWTLPNQVGWPIAKELLFTARIVEAEEAHRIGLLNHLVPRAELRAKTMEVASLIAGNDRKAVMGVKELLLRDMGGGLRDQWDNEKEYTRNVVRGAKAEDAFPDFIARKGRPV